MVHVLREVGDRDRSCRVARVLKHRLSERRQTASHRAFFGGVPPVADIAQQLPQGAGCSGPVLGLDKSCRIRKQGAHLGGGQSRQHGEPAGGEHRRQPHPDIGNEHRATRCSLLDDVEHISPMQHREMGILFHTVDQLPHDRPSDPLQWCLTRVRRAELVGSHTQSVPPLLGQVVDEAVVDQHRKQPVRGGPR